MLGTLFSQFTPVYLCVPLHNLIESKFAPSPNSPHPQFDDHRRFSAYPSLKFLTVLLIAVFIKHFSNYSQRIHRDIIVSLQSKKTLYNISIHCFWFQMLQEKSLWPFTSAICQKFPLLSQAVQNLPQNFFLIGQQRIPFLYESALSSSICGLYMWN